MSAISEYSDVEYVFEPHTRALPDLRTYVTDLWDRRHFVVELTKAQVRGPSSSTVLGRLWAVLDPLFMAGVYFFLFSVLRGSDPNRLAFLPILVGGLFLFQLSMQALGEGGQSVKMARGLMLSSSFPRAELPIATIYRGLVRFRIVAAVFVVLFPLMNGKVSMGLFVLPLLFVIQTVMNVGIALLVSTFVVLVRDGQNAVSYLTRILFFATPVIYPASTLPDAARALVAWQPLFALFEAYQQIFSGYVPDMALIVQAAAWAVVLVFLGGRWFLRNERQFQLHL